MIIAKISVTCWETKTLPRTNHNKYIVILDECKHSLLNKAEEFAKECGPLYRTDYSTVSCIVTETNIIDEITNIHNKLEELQNEYNNTKNKILKNYKKTNNTNNIDELKKIYETMKIIKTQQDNIIQKYLY